MKKLYLAALTVSWILAVFTPVGAETIVKPHTFSGGQPALAGEVNADFDTVYNQVNKLGTTITVDEVTGNVGIGTVTPARKLHVSDVMRLEPRPLAPVPAANGDLYFDSSEAFCVYTGVLGWKKLAGNGRCVVPGTVVSGTAVSGQRLVWMDRNLGALQIATGAADAAAYGALYQWGRGTDGHELRTSSTTTTLSASDTPGHGDFILATTTPYSWRNPPKNTLWQGVTGINNPCPAGFRLPTQAEWGSEYSSWGGTSMTLAFASPLKLTATGYRDYYTGAIYAAGIDGFYWSSTLTGNQPYRFVSGSGMISTAPADGASVRCLQD